MKSAATSNVSDFERYHPENGSACQNSHDVGCGVLPASNRPGAPEWFSELVNSEMEVGIDPVNMMGVEKVGYICADDIQYYDQTIIFYDSVGRIELDPVRGDDGRVYEGWTSPGFCSVAFIAGYQCDNDGVGWK